MVPLPKLPSLHSVPGNLSCDFLHTLFPHNFPEKLEPNIFGKVRVMHLEIRCQSVTQAGFELSDLSVPLLTLSAGLHGKFSQALSFFSVT